MVLAKSRHDLFLIFKGDAVDAVEYALLTESAFRLFDFGFDGGTVCLFHGCFYLLFA